MVRTGSGMAKFMKKRDKGICAICGKDCEALKKELRKALAGVPAPLKDDYSLSGSWYESTPEERQAIYQKYRESQVEYKKATNQIEKEFRSLHGIPSWRKRFWDIDHIVPVVEGGGDSGPENLRTLCLTCHKAETAKLSALRAERRRTVS